MDQNHHKYCIQILIYNYQLDFWFYKNLKMQILKNFSEAKFWWIDK